MTLPSGATARPANITEPISAPPVMTPSCTRCTPHTSITTVMSCCDTVEALLTQLESALARTLDCDAAALASS